MTQKPFVVSVQTDRDIASREHIHIIELVDAEGSAYSVEVRAPYDSPMTREQAISMARG